MPSDAAGSTFSDAILEFLRRAATERSTARLVGEMFRFFGSTFSMHRVSLFLTSDEDGLLVPFVSEWASGEADPSLFAEWKRLDAESFPVSRRVRAGEDVILCEDPTEGIAADIVDHWSLRPFLALGLRRDGELIGLLMVEGSVELLGAHREDIAVFARYLAMALANARAFERERQRAREAEALLEVGEVLSRTTELTPVLASVARNCAKAAGFDRGSVYLVDEASGQLMPQMSRFSDGHFDREAWDQFVGLASRFDIPEAWDVMRTGKPVVYDSRRPFPRSEVREWKRLFGLEAVVFLPLRAWDQTFGVLALDRQSTEPITEQQIRVAQAVAAQGAVAIAVSRLLARERAAVDRLQELDALKTTFVAAVSHELRTPLTTIIGFGELLADHVPTAEGREFLDLVRRESSHLETVIANLLLLSNLEAGILQPRWRRVDVAAVVDEAVSLIGHLHPGREVTVDGDRDAVVRRGDAAHLRQAFINLLANAANYSPPDTPIAVTVTGAGDAVRVEVTDRGPGIPLEERRLVFERFRRGRERGVEGTGIGLFIVQQVVEAHGGRVWVEAGPGGVGARFVTVLPATVPAAPDEAAERRPVSDRGAA